MTIKPEKSLRRVSSLSMRWQRSGFIVGVSLLVAGIILLFVGNLSANAASQSSVSNQVSAPTRTNVSNQRIGPLIKEAEWGMWHKGNKTESFPTTLYPYVIGQTITVSNYVSIRVDRVDRNWTPQPWQVSPYPVGNQDDATGKEVILVRFTITNLSSIPLGYSDHYFSLIWADGHEQRVATLAELTGDQYGSFGQTTPWLFPGAMVHTFVPFLVNPGESPQQFVLSWRVTDPSGAVAAPVTNGKRVPLYVNVARIPIALSLTSSQGSHSAVASSATFVSSTLFKITDANLYSPAEN